MSAWGWVLAAMLVAVAPSVSRAGTPEISVAAAGGCAPERLDEADTLHLSGHYVDAELTYSQTLLCLMKALREGAAEADSLRDGLDHGFGALSAMLGEMSRHKEAVAISRAWLKVSREAAGEPARLARTQLAVAGRLLANGQPDEAMALYAGLAGTDATPEPQRSEARRQIGLWENPNRSKVCGHIGTEAADMAGVATGATLLVGDASWFVLPGEDGRFCLSALPGEEGGTGLLVLSAQGHMPRLEVVGLPRGARQTVSEVRLERLENPGDGVIAGVVMAPGTRPGPAWPVPGVTVSFEGEEGEEGVFSGVTDAFGFYAVPVPQGEYRAVEYDWTPVVVRASETVVHRRDGTAAIPTH